jgi:flagellar hook assembly protein FlgD
LEVIDQNDQTQATLLDHRRRSAKQHVLLWDGYDDFGRPVPAGTYTVRATAGAPPIKVSSAVQIQIEEDPYVYRKASQFERVQSLSAAQAQAHRRVRQNRKRI